MKLIYGMKLLAVIGMTLSIASHGEENPSSPAIPLPGIVSGLTSAGLILQNNGGDTLAIDTNGGFSFAGVNGADYAISILSQPAGSTCIVTNSHGKMGTTPAAPIIVNCTPAYTVGGTVTGLTGTGLRLRNNGADPVAISAEGLFTFPTALPAGDAYNVSVDTQSNESVCRVNNGTGIVGINNVTNVSITCYTNASGFAYVLNPASKTISPYRIDAKTGALTTAGAPITAGTDPLSLTIDPLGRFAYVANYGSNDISIYHIDRTTGALTAAGAPIAMGSYPISVAVDPAGRFAYVAYSGANSIAAYRIDADTGALTAAGTPIATGAYPIFVAVDTAGRFAYVVNYGSNTVVAYRIDADSGTLTAAGTPVATGAFPFSITFDPAGKSAYVTNSGSNTVSSYRIDADSGTLTPLGAPVATGTDPQFVAMDPGGRFAYVTNYSSNNVSVYRIAPTGALTATGSPIATGGIPISISTDPTGKYAYVATLNAGNNVATYRINEKSGTLTAMGPRKTTGASWFSFTAR